MEESIVPQFNLSSTLDYSKLKNVLEPHLETHGTANDVFRYLGREGILGLFIETCPETYDLVQGLRDIVATSGAAVLHETKVDEVDDEVAQLSAIVLSSAFGTPTRTDQKNKQIAWPIRYDPDTKLTRTFSQSLGEAAFHTDTQYFELPEKYFGLFCIISDVPGKGTNKLINGVQLLGRFEDEYGGEVRQALELPYPFRVPSVFTKHASNEELEITWAPIFDKENNSIRYRNDTIMKALEAAGVVIDDRQYDALGKLDHLLGQLEPVRYHLTPGDAILVNNHTTLHARTAFDNPNRFLYRVRMNSD